MRALNVRLPWAWLIVNGHKKYELRSRRTNVRERIAIRASKVDKKSVTYVRENWPNIQLPPDERLRTMQGSVVGAVEMIDCKPVGSIRNLAEGGRVRRRDLGKAEFAWVLHRPTPLNPPLSWTPPSGAIIWSTLPAHVERRLGRKRG